MDLQTLGKRALFFGAALLIGLSLGLRILEAHSPSHIVPYKNPNGMDFLTDRGNTIQELKGQSTASANEKGVLLPISSPEAQRILKKSKNDGKPFFYLSSRQLYAVDEDGKILGLANALPHRDLPIITGDAVSINTKKQRLAGNEFEEVVELLQRMDDMDNLLFNQISEIHLEKNVGMIAYLNVARSLPIIIGRGSLERKVAYLDAFLEQLGSTGLVEQAKYLDVRLAGQIILKKNG